MASCSGVPLISAPSQKVSFVWAADIKLIQNPIAINVDFIIDMSYIQKQIYIKVLKFADFLYIFKLRGIKMGKRLFEEIHDMKPLEIIGKYTNPVLIVQGDNDSVVLISDWDKASQLYKDARLHVIPGASHGFNTKEIKEQNEQIRIFLTEK